MSRRPFVKQFLSQRHRQQYFQAKEHQRSRRQQFQHFRRVGMSYADGQLYIWRRRNKRYADCCVMAIDLWEEKV